MRFLTPLLVLFLWTAFAPTAFAAAWPTLTLASDLISTSVPSATSTHTITFATALDLPLGGKIVVRPEGATFDFPVGMDFTDIDVATAPSSAGPFTERPLAAAASAIADGVSVTTGLGGSLTITLGDVASGAIASTTVVRIKIGSNATFEVAGTRNLVNPSSPNMYRIRIVTRDAADVELDNGSPFVAIMTVSTMELGTIEPPPPIRSNGRPTGLLPGSTVAVQLVLNTDIFAFCRYSTTASTSYSAMTDLFSYTNDHMTHYATVSGLLPQTSYVYYVRCTNGNGSKTNGDDYPIAFDVGAIPLPGVASGPTGPSGSGGGGGNFLPPVSEVVLDGKTFPGGTITVLRDGVSVLEAPIDSAGNIRASFTDLPRGTYTWSIFGKDPDGRKTTTYSSAIFLIARTTNVIAPIYLSPTVSAPKTVEAGTPVTLTGYAIANTPVFAIMNKQGNALGTIIVATGTSAGSGKYTLTLPTAGLAKGTYEVKVQSELSAKDASNFSPLTYVGIGEDANPDFGLRADLNKDKKVNLVDFSILLFHWKTADTTADINQDGTVNLTDFSIMLSFWTG